MPDDVPLLELSSISVRRGRVNVLNSIDLKISSGEVVLLIGENGSGKSTLIEAAAGLLPLSTGEVRHSGQLVRDCEGRRSRPKPFGLALQSGGFSQDEFVDERIATAVAVAGYEAESDWIIAQLDEWSLRHRAKDRIAWLSGGMKRRVGVLAGIVPALASNEEKLILLDEPSEGLDEISINTLQKQIASLAAAGHAIVIATHDENLSSLATRQLTVDKATISEKEIAGPSQTSKPPDCGTLEKSSENLLNNPSFKWANNLEKRTKNSTITRSVAGLIALVVITGMLAQITAPSNQAWVALLALTPPLISALVRPGVLVHLSDSRAQDWWNAHLGNNLQMSRNLPPLTLIPFLLTLLSAYFVIGNIDLQIGLIAVAMAILGGGSARVHALESTFPRQGATMIILLQLIFIWPFLLLVDLLSMDASTFATRDAEIQLLTALVIPFAIWLILPMIAPE
ncbi:MAG TPA: ATP-binding cassette domain-containing protein [Candidatus Thalassarchaeaceae archaeon]|jgi:ABC-type multidrug transport system ATPase subunit|nr:ATP-binding cassette domain-containing protein [Candidatus Thalassarchaeaceae archaeon]